jgi:hypothetical protein
MDELDVYLQLIDSWAQRRIGELPDRIDPLHFLVKQLKSGHADISTAVA